MKYLLFYYVCLLDYACPNFIDISLLYIYRCFQQCAGRKNLQIIVCSYVFLAVGITLSCFGVTLEVLHSVLYARGLIFICMGIAVIIPSGELHVFLC